MIFQKEEYHGLLCYTFGEIQTVIVMPVSAPQAELCPVQNALKVVQLPIWQWFLLACLILEAVSDGYLLYISNDVASLVEKPSSSRKWRRRGKCSQQTCRSEAFAALDGMKVGVLVLIYIQFSLNYSLKCPNQALNVMARTHTVKTL